jgi:hypothetical protein
LSIRIDKNGDPTGRCGAKYAADITAVIYISASSADSDNVTGCGDSGSGILAERDIIAPCDVSEECRSADGCVAAAELIMRERTITDGRV